MIENEKELKRAIGGRVQKAREKNGWSRNRLADVIGLSDGTALYKYERGSRGFSTHQLSKISVALGVTIEWLVYGQEWEERMTNVPPREAAAPLKPGLKIDPQDAKARLAGLGVHAEIDSEVPEPILNLINLSWIPQITNADIRQLKIYLAAGGSPAPLDTAVAVWLHRIQDDSSETNRSGLNEAIRRRAERGGVKHFQEPERSIAIPTQEAANAPEARPKRPPLKRRKRDSEGD